MSLKEFYHWQGCVRQAFGFLGCWQVLGLALYSYGVVLARQCAPSRVAEKLIGMGKAWSRRCRQTQKTSCVRRAGPRGARAAGCIRGRA